MSALSGGSATPLPIGQQVFLIELDALLDTRLGVAATLDQSAFNDILNHPGYRTRKTDDLSLFTDRFTKEEYAQAWAKRDTECLRHSLVTNYIRMLASQSADLHQDMADKNNPHVQSVKFIINTHPYVMSREERDEIEHAVRHYVMPGIQVSSCRLPYSTLNFSYVRANYSTMVLYNFRDWMEQCEGKEYDGPGAPQVTIMAPALFGPGGRPSEEDIHTGLNVDEHVDDDVLFGLTEYTMSYIMTLAFQDIDTFSILSPKPSKAHKPTPPQ